MRIVILFFLQFSALTGFSVSYERFEENGKVGLRDDSGHIILPASFDALGWSDGNFSLVGQITGYRKDNRWGLLNLKKEFITQPLYEYLITPKGDRVVATKMVGFTLKSGCVDLEGKVVIPFIYDEIKLFELRAIVMNKNGTLFQYGLIDLNGNVVLPLQYQRIQPLGSLRYVVQDFKNKSAICTESGKWVTGFIIDEVSDFLFDLAVIRQDWRCGIIDRNGNVKIEPRFREIKITGPDRISARTADEWRVINTKQEVIRKAESDQMIFGFNEWNRVRLNGKWGFVDRDFNLRWPYLYDALGANDDGHVVAKKDGKYRLLRMDQSDVLGQSFDSICAQGNFIRVINKAPGKNFWELYDTFGIRKSSSYEWIGLYDEFFPVKKRGHWGVMDRYGKEQVACVYDSLWRNTSDLLAVRFKGQFGIITREDEWKVSPQPYPIQAISSDRYLVKQDSITFLKDFQGATIYFTTNRLEPFGNALFEKLPDGTLKEINLQGQIVMRQKPVVPPTEQLQFRESEGMTGIKRDDKFGFVDSRGRLRIANRYDGVQDFHEGLAAMKLVGKWGYLNAHDEIVIQPTFDRVENFNNHIAIVTRKGKSGLIDNQGSVLLELRYDSIKRLSSGAFTIAQNGLMGLADRQGRIQIEPRFENLSLVGGQWVLVKQKDKFGLLTPDGMSIFPIQYSSLKFFGGNDEFLAHLEFEWKEIEIK